MKAYWRVEVKLHIFLTSALDGDERSAARPDSFNPKEKSQFKEMIYPGNIYFLLLKNNKLVA
jgi:hypothetical protein